MKLHNVIGYLVITTIFITGCGGGENNKAAVNADDVIEGVDICDVCHMGVANDEFATQLVLENGKVLKFDDIGCQHIYKRDIKPDANIAAEYVRDYYTLEWVHMHEATFVYDESLQTPMGFGIYSFKDKESAEKLIDEEQLGQLLTFDDLKEDHHWRVDINMYSGMDLHAFDQKWIDYYFPEGLPEDYHYEGNEDHQNSTDTKANHNIDEIQNEMDDETEHDGDMHNHNNSDEETHQ